MFSPVSMGRGPWGRAAVMIVVVNWIARHDHWRWIDDRWCIDDRWWIVVDHDRRRWNSY
jgi:hypothetical protein